MRQKGGIRPNQVPSFPGPGAPANKKNFAIWWDLHCLHMPFVIDTLYIYIAWNKRNQFAIPWGVKPKPFIWECGAIRKEWWCGIMSWRVTRACRAKVAVRVVPTNLWASWRGAMIHMQRIIPLHLVLGKDPLSFYFGEQSDAARATAHSAIAFQLAHDQICGARIPIIDRPVCLGIYEQPVGRCRLRREDI